VPALEIFAVAPYVAADALTGSRKAAEDNAANIEHRELAWVFINGSFVYVVIPERPDTTAP
jgi:hypothetical protein